MKLLLLCCPEDESYIDRFQRLSSTVGHKILKTTTAVDNIIQLERLLEAHKLDGVLCAQVSTLQILLEALPDYIKPDSRKKLSLHDYAGNCFPIGKSGKQAVILEPLARLRTVAEETYVVNRFVSKLTAPHTWRQQTQFKWKEITLDNEAAVFEEIKRADLCAIDIECPWPQLPERPITCVSYTTWDAKTNTTCSYVIPFKEKWQWLFVKKANATTTRKVFQNGLFDNAYFLRWGCPVTGWFYDTLHLFHSWLAELPKRLDFIASFAIRDIRFWKNDGKTGNLQDLYRYNALDGWATINSLLGILHECEPYAITNYVEHEFPLVFPCLTAALEGLDCDVSKFEQITKEKEEEVSNLLSRLQYLVGEEDYNPASAKQNSALFAVLGCSDLVKQEYLSDRENARRGTGKIPTQKAKARHPLNNLILTEVENYKQAAKQVSTYFDADKLWAGRIYYSINPGGTDTGRASSAESAFDCGWQIQNVPRDDLSFKSCVVAPDGWFIGEADKAQAEARCVGYLSGEEKLIQLVESSKDYHSWNASSFFGVPYTEIYDEAKKKTLNKPLRDLAKRTNHGANYNMGGSVMLDTMGPLKAAQAKATLKLPRHFKLLQVCEYLLEQYNKTYPKIKGEYYASIVLSIKRTGTLVSPFGWVRKFFGDPSTNKQDLNSAVAHPSQNLSVAIVNREWYRIWRDTIYGSLRGRVRIKAQIHDSFLFIYRTLADAEQVLSMMDQKVQVTDPAGVTRTLFIPSELSVGETPTRRWSELK